MSRKLSRLSMRLERVERVLADRAKQKDLANCICKQPTLAIPGQSEVFEAEMNRICPVHGFRRLGGIMVIRFVAPASYPESEKEKIRQQDAELDRLLNEYHSRALAWMRARSARHSSLLPGGEI